MSKSGKGSKYEREICVKLSEWWTKGYRDDIFWRTAGSGARSKTRGRKGKSTYGQSGDIGAIDPIGDPLIDFLTIEIKRGYSKFTIQDILDAPRSAAQQQMEDWLQQCIESAEHAGSFAWLLIVKRDFREPLVLMPRKLYKVLKVAVPDFPDARPLFSFQAGIRFRHLRETIKTKVKGKVRKSRKYETFYHDYHITGTTLDMFLAYVSPDVIKKLVRKL